jgi:hypothetical protein
VPTQILLNAWEPYNHSKSSSCLIIILSFKEALPKESSQLIAGSAAIIVNYKAIVSGEKSNNSCRV